MVKWRTNDIPNDLLDEVYLARVIGHLNKCTNDTDGTHSGINCDLYRIEEDCKTCILFYASTSHGLCNEPMPIEEKIELVSSLLSPERRVRIKILNELNS
jgi:hypothetical protein